MVRCNSKKQILSLALSFFLLLIMMPVGFATADGEVAGNRTTEMNESERTTDNIDGELPETEEAESGELLENIPTEEEALQSEWETRLLLMLQEHNANPDTIAAGYYNFATGEEHYYNGDEYRVSGSMYKVPLNMLFLDWVAEGNLTMDELISGYRYSELLEGTIINSDNDYARILWDYAGATIQTDPASTYYHRYRILIAPIMGEDPETVDDKYYENNFFTPRQMITCLRRLYDGGSRYDRLIETMQRAEPEKYFKLREQRFNIAHKYGWYAEDPILYLNDCALCFTDDPIAIVLFTSGTENAYGVLADYCTLMCDYAQEKHAERIEREQAEAEAIAAAAVRDREEARKAEEEQPVQSPAVSTAPQKLEDALTTAEPAVAVNQRGLSAGPVIALALIVGCTLAAIIWFAARHRNGRLQLGYGIAAVLLSAAACMVCFPVISGNGYVTDTQEEPAETVDRFFRALQEGDYAAADSCLADGAKLGLADAFPQDETHAAAVAALKDSWAYRMLGTSTVEKTDAWQELQLQVLDFSKMEQDIQRVTREQLLEMGRTMARSSIYDENGDYRPEAAGLAYDRAMAELLRKPQDYYSSVGLRLRLTMTRDGWKIVPTKELITALSGNLPA